jgi:hypothetical protein
VQFTPDLCVGCVVFIGRCTLNPIRKCKLTRCFFTFPGLLWVLSTTESGRYRITIRKCVRRIVLCIAPSCVLGQTVLYAARTAALLVVLPAQQWDYWAGEGRPTHCGWLHTAIDKARPLSIWRHATVWPSPSWDRISCDRLHGANGAQFAEFRDVRASALPILERKIFCQVHFFSLINYCVLGQYSLKSFR